MALANPATVQMCEQQCEALLASLCVQDALLTRVRRLRRPLAAMGISYQQVLDEVRKGLALQYIATIHLPLYEIACLLGFSDPSNFRRAFHKWTGRLPSDYRAEP